MPIPEYGTAESGKPLRDIVRATSNKVAMSESLVGIVMTHFFEQFAIQMCRGHAVSIPGVGMFAAYMYQSRAYPEYRYPQPRFYPAKGLRNEVASGLGPNATTQKRIDQYTKNHCVTPGKRQGKAGRATTMTAMHKFRSDIEAQAREMGLDPYDSGS